MEILGQPAMIILQPYTSFLTQIPGTLVLLENEAIWLLTRRSIKVFDREAKTMNSVLFAQVLSLLYITLSK